MLKGQGLYKKSNDIRCRLLYRCINALIWKQESIGFNAILRTALKTDSTHKKDSRLLKLAAVLRGLKFVKLNKQQAFHIWLEHSKRMKKLRFKYTVAITKVSYSNFNN